MLDKFDQEIEKLQQKIQEVRQKEKEYLDDLALTLGSDLIKHIPKEAMPKNKKEQKILSNFLCGLYQDYLNQEIKENETSVDSNTLDQSFNNTVNDFDSNQETD